MPRYSGDPYWTSARWPSKCACKRDGCVIRKGQRIFYYPKSKSAYGGECAHAASRDFDAAAFDESMLTGSW